ncbi:MAG: rhamnogalacturonan acetylesterase [Chitinophagaceae bacterium]
MKKLLLFLTVNICLGSLCAQVHFVCATNGIDTNLKQEDLYSDERGYGFSPVGGSSNALLFSSKLKEGNYKVSVTVLSSKKDNGISVKVENRRLMLLNQPLRKNKKETFSFLVHVRDSLIHGTKQQIRLKLRERSYPHWDNKLTLEIYGKDIVLKNIQIDTVSYSVPTIFLAGNSTVVDQPYEPWAAWGQMLPCMLRSDSVIVANYAESGETIKAFVRENRLKKIFSLAKPGDYLFVEFAHNDQKKGGNHLEPFTSYKDSLKSWVVQARERKLIPVLVTSISRRNFGEDGKIVNTLGDYPEAMRQVARELNAVLIDLNAMTTQMYEAWGAEKSTKAFVHFPANTFPGQQKELKDNTHFTSFGAYEVAKCVATKLAHSDLGVGSFVLPQYRVFDPSQPDSFSDVPIPMSPINEVRKPDGN